MNTSYPPDHPLRRNLPLAIFLVAVIIGMTLWAVNGDFPKHSSTASYSDRSLIVTAGSQSQVPDELARLHLIDTAQFSPYNIQARSLADGGTQYVASYDTRDLHKEYERFKSMVQLNEMFLLQTDALQGGNFTLSFGRSFDRLQIFGIADEANASGTVVISFYSRL